MSRTVVITGATGNIGTKLRSHFTELGWTLRLLDLTDGGDPAVFVSDLARWDAGWVSTLTDADAVILLAGQPNPSATWSQVTQLNLDLTLNVYEAAVRERVKRVIFASSNWVMAGHRFADGDLRTDREPYPINAYGMSKLAGERIGRSFSERWDISSINFRIGYCQRGENRPGSHMGWGSWGQEMWLSDRDLCDGFEKAVIAPLDIGFAVLNLMSENPGMRWDIETTKRMIGYAPRDGVPAYSTPEQIEGASTAKAARALMQAAEDWLATTRY